MKTTAMDYSEETKNMDTEDLFDSLDFNDKIADAITDAVDHAILVSNLASHLARELGNDEDFCYATAVAGMLHDIGKLRLDEYLSGYSADTLKVEEMKHVRMHPTLGYEFLKAGGEYSDEILEAVYHHHENFDGSGYPSNLKGEDIPYMARIIRVCDVFAALISERSYRAAFDTSTAVELMIDEFKNYDMKIFLSFLSMIHLADIEELQEYAEEINQKIRNRRKTTA